MTSTERRYVLVVAPRVEAQLAQALGWWQANRDKSPGLLARELERAFAVLEVAPHLAQRARVPHFGVLRRMLLPRSRYHLYYRIDESAGQVELVRFRHAMREPLR